MTGRTGALSSRATRLEKIGQHFPMDQSRAAVVDQLKARPKPRSDRVLMLAAQLGNFFHRIVAMDFD